MKRLTAIILALAMLLSLTAVAFANGFTPAAEQLEVRAGETLSVKYTVDEAVDDLAAGEVRLMYDADLFDVDLAATKKAEKLSGVGFHDTVFGTGAESYIKSSFFYIEESGAFQAGDTYATLVVTAKEDITEEKTAVFKAVVENAEKSASNITSTFELRSTTVTVKPALQEAAGYTVAAGGSASVLMGETAQVTLAIGNKDVTGYNAYDITLTYNSDVLHFDSAEAVQGETPTVSDSNGTLRITGYGADKACAADKLVLNFTAKAIGEGTVTVTAAKVDEKANAITNDAPAATITAAAVTVAVTGHPVTLPDAFSGAASAEPGKDYTFTAKDASKKYDFTGSTMGGEAVTVIDNNDGTYTIRNITGALHIVAAEKASTVTVRLTNNTAATIYQLTDGQEVQPNQSFSFIVMDNTGSGGEFVVTANGTTLDGRFQAGRFFYTVPAQLVTGSELQIVVNYKTEDKATISMTGDWSDVVNKTWGTETSVAAGTDLRFTMTQQDGFTYVVTVNGTEIAGRSIQGSSSYVYSIDGATYVKAGETVTIHISKTAALPAYTVTVSEYLKLDGQSLFLITAVGDTAAGKLPAYDGNAMYYSAKYNGGEGAYVWLVSSTKTLAEVTAEETAAKITVVDETAASKVSVSYNGDVNLTGSTDVNDAQLVWNMYNAEYKADTGFQTVNRLKYLSADMNGDGKLDTTDAAAVAALLIG